MPITLNGSNITTNQLNSAAVTNEALNGATVYPAGGGQTAMPTVGTPYCGADGVFNYLYVSVTNNDSTTVTIRNGTINLGTLGANSTGTILITSGFSTPYTYNVNINAIASGKTASDNVNRSGTVLFCQLM